MKRHGPLFVWIWVWVIGNESSVGRSDPSNSGCRLSLAQENEPSTFLECEWAFFGPATRTAATSFVPQGDDELACSPLDAESAAGKVVVATRGTCPMSKKALHAQAAGAVGFVCINSEPGESPARMRSFGDEVQLVTIPCVMISKEDGDRLRALNGPVELGIDSDITPEHPLSHEMDLKSQVYASGLPDSDKGEPIMRLAEYWAQGNWTSESTVLIRQAAAHSPHNPDLLYGVATYGTQSPALYLPSLLTLTSLVIP